jgi:hypothetical protein
VGFLARAWAAGKSGRALAEEDDDAARTVERPGCAARDGGARRHGALIAPPLGRAPVEDHPAAGDAPDYMDWAATTYGALFSAQADTSPRRHESAIAGVPPPGVAGECNMASPRLVKEITNKRSRAECPMMISRLSSSSRG